MTTTTFEEHRMPAWSRREVRLVRPLIILAVVTSGMAWPSSAQIPGAPVLQNVWATPGVVGALDIGTGSGGSVYAAAGSWTPGSGRFELSGGLGYQRLGGGAGSRGVYGVRAAIPFGGATSTFGFGAFAGIGGGPSRVTAADTIFTPGGPQVTGIDSVTSTVQIPLGVSVGWRHAIGATHGVSIYASPSYTFFSGGNGGSGGLIRGAIGADFGITSKLGATVGFEFGATREQGFGGPTGSSFGLGLSYAFSHP
jgi:hypothetical protein